MAVTVTPFSTDGANARQISAVPFCTLVLSTSTQVRPPPATCVTVVFGEETPSAEINASSSSLPEVVEKAGVLTVVLAVPWSLDVVVSIPQDRGGSLSRLVGNVYSAGQRAARRIAASWLPSPVISICRGR